MSRAVMLEALEALDDMIERLEFACGSEDPNRPSKVARAKADALRAALAAAPGPSTPVTLADVLDALNVFKRPEPSEDDGPWEAGHFIRVDHLPNFINILAAAWFSRGPLTDQQIDAICAPGRAARWRNDGRQYDRDTARIIERAHGIGADA